ncbi:MAG TPA: XDD4 family exosortase-dependent surface protein [Candidatus Limnocylindrales bacterium]|nr:XDD4 family exosortase-dependent surface protein [Candidatus Limnocylindrales bacterium]
MTGQILKRRILGGLVAMVFVGGLAASAEATTIIKTGTSGSGASLRHAWVRFEQAAAGAPIVVTLANITTNQVDANPEVLTAVFFNLNGTPTLTKTTAVLADRVNNSGVQVTTDSTVQNCSGGQCPSPNSTGGNVGGEWAYRFNSVGLNPSGVGQFEIDQKYGISGSGLGGTFGAGDRFDTSQNLDGGTSPGGVDYGLTSFSDTGPTNPGTEQTKNAMAFSFLVPGGYTLATVTDVRFQYGSGLNECVGCDIDVPLPASLILLSSAFLGVGALIELKRRRKLPQTSKRPAPRGELELPRP